MSLDIYIEGTQEIEEQCACPHCGNEHTEKRYPELGYLNITHNLAKMADECGVYEYVWRPEENGIKVASDMIVHLENGIDELQSTPLNYERLNPSNGWGSYEILVKFLMDYLEICKEHPTAKITACR